MRRILPWAALVVLVLLIVVPLRAQFSGGGGGGVVSVPIESGLPANPTNGQIAIRGFDRQMFVYHSDIGKWLGELKLISANIRISDATGSLRMGEVNTSSSTPFQGYDQAATDSLRILRVTGKSFDVATVAACTTEVRSDGTGILKLVWNANEELWLPSGGTGGWISPNPDRVCVAPGATMSVFQLAGGAVQLDLPIIWFYCRDEAIP